MLPLLARIGRDPYSLCTFFLTNLVLLGTTLADQAVTTSLERVGYTVVAAVLSLLAIGAYEVFFHPQKDPTDGTVAAQRREGAAG